jgi:hypothetical protein
MRRLRDNPILAVEDATMIAFKGVHYPREVILYAVFFT